MRRRKREKSGKSSQGILKKLTPEEGNRIIIGKRGREKGGERERQTYRQTDRQTDREGQKSGLESRDGSVAK